MTLNPPYIALEKVLAPTPCPFVWHALADALPLLERNGVSVDCLILHSNDRVSQGYLFLDADEIGRGWDKDRQATCFVEAWMPMPPGRKP